MKPNLKINIAVIQLNNTKNRSKLRMYEKQNQKLLKEVLIEPINNNCNKLKIVSGFVSFPMLDEHLSLVKKAGKIN